MEPAVIAPEPAVIEGRMRRLEHLQDVCRVVSSALDLDQVLQFICGAVRDGLDLDRVVIYSIDHRTQRIIGPRAVAPPLSDSPEGDLECSDGAMSPAWSSRGVVPSSGAPPGDSPQSGARSAATPGITGCSGWSGWSGWSMELRRGASAATDVALGQAPYYLCNEAADPSDLPEVRGPVPGGRCPVPGGPDEPGTGHRAVSRSDEGRSEFTLGALVWAGFQTERPMAVVPLRGRTQIVGLMLVSTAVSGRRLSDQTIEDLRPFAEQAAMAIEQANFFVESQRRVGFLSALLQISTSLNSHSELTELLQGACDKLLEVSGLQIAAIYLAEGGSPATDEGMRGKGDEVRAPASTLPSSPHPLISSSPHPSLRLHTIAGMRPDLPEFYEPFRVGERLAGRAALERLVIVSRNLQQDPSKAASIARRIGLRTVVCAPLLLRGELLGVLTAGTVNDVGLTGEETDVVSSVANQLAAAIANARLLEETRYRMVEYQRRGDELSLLYHISRAVVGTIGLEERLRVIAEGLAEVTGTTRCAIFRVDRLCLLPWVSYGDTPEEKRQFQALDVSSVDAARLLRRLMSARKRGHLSGTTPAGRCPPSGGSRLRPPTKVPLTESVGPGPGAATVQVMREIDEEPFSQVPWLRAWGVRSALWLPLAYQNRLTGLALVYQPGEARIFPAEQVRLAAAVANQAAIAIRASQAYEHERNVAETLQRSFMPTVAARLRNFDLGQTYHPALKEAQVGGDFYDVFWLPNGRVALLMADVSGKGLAAAMQTAMVKYMLRAYAVEDPSPASVLARLNQAVSAFSDPDLFVTAFYGVLCPNSGQLQYGNAGHDSPILALKEHRYCTSLDITGPALGMEPGMTYFSRTIELTPGDLLLLYTDGITNARRGDELFGRERLVALLAELEGLKPARIVSQIYRTVRAFAEGNLSDDCALLALKAKEAWKYPAQP